MNVASRRPLLVAAIYLALVLVAVSLPFVLRDGLVGIWAILLTLPWSLLPVATEGQALPEALARLFAGPGLPLAGGLLNSLLLHWILSHSPRHPESRATEDGGVA